MQIFDKEINFESSSKGGKECLGYTELVVQLSSISCHDFRKSVKIKHPTIDIVIVVKVLDNFFIGTVNL